MGRPGRLAEAARDARCGIRTNRTGGDRAGREPRAGPVWLGRMRAGGAALSKSGQNITRTIFLDQGNRRATGWVVEAGCGMLAGGLMALPGLREAPLDLPIATAASLPPGSLHNDTPDRLVIETARVLGVKVLTRDAAILAYGTATCCRNVIPY